DRVEQIELVHDRLSVRRFIVLRNDESACSISPVLAALPASRASPPPAARRTGSRPPVPGAASGHAPVRAAAASPGRPARPFALAPAAGLPSGSPGPTRRG